MAPYWKNRNNHQDVVSVVEALSYLVKEKDDEGIDITFMVSDKRLVDCRSTTNLLRTLNTISCTGGADINLSLSRILDRYLAELGQAKRRKGPMNTKPRSLYILTNGEWKARNYRVSSIRSLFERLSTNGRRLPGSDQIGIELINFGATSVSLELIKRLEYNLDLDL
jgi:hypothetical protein